MSWGHRCVRTRFKSLDSHICAPAVVSCSGSCLCLSAQLSHLFVTHKSLESEASHQVLHSWHLCTSLPIQCMVVSLVYLQRHTYARLSPFCAGGDGLAISMGGNWWKRTGCMTHSVQALRFLWQELAGTHSEIAYGEVPAYVSWF